MMTMEDIYNNAQKAVYARCAEQKRIIQQYEEPVSADIEKIAECIGFGIATALVLICIVL